MIICDSYKVRFVKVDELSLLLLLLQVTTFGVGKVKWSAIAEKVQNKAQIYAKSQ